MKILAAQINLTVGDLLGNFEKMKAIISQHPSVDLIVFPELALSGYPPLDLTERVGFCEEQLTYLDKLAQATLYTKATVIVGYFDKNTKGVGKPFHNGLAVLRGGEIKYRYFKRLLPTYNIFDESRHFESGDVIGTYELNGVKLGLLICEDMWNDKAVTTNFIYPINPVKETAEAGVDLIVSINASPSNVGKPEYRLERFAKIAADYKTPLIYVNQVGGNDDIVFDGTSFAVDADGTTHIRLPSFEEDLCQVIFDKTTKSFDSVFFSGVVYEGNAEEAKKKRPEAYFHYRQIVLGIRDYVRKCGFKKAAIACSGGVDSAIVLALAVDAIGAENVVAITMPSAISSTGSVTDSEKLCENLGVNLYSYPIANIVDSFLGNFTESFGEAKRSITKENLQARVRGTLLMGFTNEFEGYLPLTTGNKSECAVGYCTIYGDMNGGLAPISDLYKTEVWELCRLYNDLKWREVIPNVIIDKEPSAELYEGQKDTNSLPPYPVLDAVLIPYIEGNEVAPALLEKCKKVVQENGFTDFAKIHRMVDRAEFKRRQAAPTIRVHQKAWGSGRRLPIAQRHNPVNAIV